MNDKNESDITFYKNFITKHSYLDKYFIKNSYIDNKEVHTCDEIFLQAAHEFSIQFHVQNFEIQNFWNAIVNCLSIFLIKKAYQNSRKRYDNYKKEQFTELQFKSEYIKISELGRGSGGRVDMIYYIPSEEIFALKMHSDLELNERERDNYLNIRFQ